MELKQFIDECIAEVNEGIGNKDDFVLQGPIHFDVTLDTSKDKIEVARGGEAKAPGLPRVSFDLVRSAK